MSSLLLPVTGPDIHPVEFDVSLSYTCLPGDKKGVVLASKIKRKKGKKNKVKKVSTPSIPKKKKKRSKKKGRMVDNLEVTTSTVDVLENPKHLDDDYHVLKKKVVEKVSKLAEITQVSGEEPLEQKIKQILSTDCDTFYLVDLSTIILKYKNWVKHLPRVKPHYAMKCNPDPRIVAAITACGAGLDVASMPEMQRGLDAGVEPNSMIFANPCKMPEHVRFAKKNGVLKMTFDNATELRKIHELFPEANLVLRILADDSHSTMRFGSKFGANVNNEAEELLKLAYSLNLKVIGVSFHVGSGCQSGEAFRNSLVLARKVFDIAESHNQPMTFLDIGGGFLGSDTPTVVFADIAASITKCLDELFPNTTVIGEPGRYFASECVVLVTTVIARRERVHHDEGHDPETYVDYYISDGVYGSFNNMFFDYYKPSPHPMKGGEGSHWSSPIGAPINSPSQHHSTLFGPTCDSIDVVCKDVELPELEIGDHVYFFNMGAYTSAAASSFNGFVPPKSHFIIS